MSSIRPRWLAAPRVLKLLYIKHRHMQIKIPEYYEYVIRSDVLILTGKSYVCLKQVFPYEANTLILILILYSEKMFSQDDHKHTQIRVCYHESSHELLLSENFEI